MNRSILTATLLLASLSIVGCKKPPATSSPATLSYPCNLSQAEGRKQAPDLYDDICGSAVEVAAYPCTAAGKQEAPDLWADVCGPQTQLMSTKAGIAAAAWPCSLGDKKGRQAAPDIYDDACVATATATTGHVKSSTGKFPCNLGPVEGRRQAPDLYDDLCKGR
jgi:hypothetical protein